MEAQQQQQYHYHYQTQNDATASVSVSYDQPQSQSQTQTYDHSTQSYYAYPYSYPYPQPQHQDFSSYYYPHNYSNSYQNQTQNDPISIHPPGVSIQTEITQTHVQNSQNCYYPSGDVVAQPPATTTHGYMQPGQSAYGSGGSYAGQGTRGGGRSTFGRRGRGRGGGRSKHILGTTAGSSTITAAQSSSGQGKQPAQMAWCELCRVDCNTLEILGQHKNGKKHKRNLKLQEELQNVNRQMTVQNPQMPLPKSKFENLSSEPAPNKNKPESEAAVKAEPSGAPPSEGSGKKDHSGGGGGLKRKVKGVGRGGKSMRAYDGSRRPVELPKKKQMVPLICDLCNVKCESQVVYKSHVAGKKHLANVKRFQSHKEAFGEGIQALYPAIPNLSSTSNIPQACQEVPQEAYALASTMLSPYNLPDPLAARAALAQLLHQYGIHDAETLIAQLVPYLLAQAQVAGSLAAPAAGLRMVASQQTETQAPQVSPAGTQHVAANAEAQAEANAKEESHAKQSLQNQVEGPLETDIGGTQPDPSILGKEDANIGDCDKQSN